MTGEAVQSKRALPREHRIGATAHNEESLGGPIVLLVIYFILEYYRPVNPLALPLMISLALFVYWASLPKKIWASQAICFYLLLGVIAVMGPFARNNFSIWQGFQAMFAMLACISIPMMHFANSLRKIAVLINVLIVLHVYVAIFAILHNGFGPGGSVGDENDVALALDVMIPIAFCSSLSAKAVRSKAFFLIATVIMIAGVVASNSRGGFLGLLAVVGYCFVFSPRKGLGLALGGLLCVGAYFVIPNSYWEEMATISRDAESDVGTGAHRKKLWGIAINMFLANPLFGVGLNNFTWNAGEYMDAELYEKEGRSYSGTVAHSVYFTILAETGGLGSALVLAIVSLSIRDIKDIIKKTKPMIRDPTVLEGRKDDVLQVRAWAYGLRGAMLGFGAAGVFLTAFVYGHFWYVVGLIVALHQVFHQYLRRIEEPQEGDPDGARKVLMAGPAAHSIQP